MAGCREGGVREGEEYLELSHLSGSFCSNTIRLVWSRMILGWIKQPRSSFFARNIDMLGTIDFVWASELQHWSSFRFRCCVADQISGWVSTARSSPETEGQLPVSRGHQLVLVPSTMN